MSSSIFLGLVGERLGILIVDRRPTSSPSLLAEGGGRTELGKWHERTVTNGWAASWQNQENPKQ